MLRCPIMLAVILAGLAELAPADDVQVRLIELTEVRQVTYDQPQNDQQVVVTSNCVPGLTLEIELVGAPAGTATEYGLLKLDRAVDDQGRALRFRSAGFVNDPREDFEPINREMMFFGRKEEGRDKLLLNLNLELPPRDAKQIRELTGQLTLRTVTTQAVLIDNVRNMTGQAVTNDRLKTAGVTVTVLDSHNPNSIKIEVRGQTEAIAGVSLVDNKGTRLNESSWSMGSGDRVVHELHGGKTLPATTKLQLDLVTNRNDVPVRFSFQNLDLP